MIEIKFAAVSQCFHGRKILGPLDCGLCGGRITAVTGRNGIGKSTFLKLAGHFLMPSSGKVTVTSDGMEMRGEVLRRRIAMVMPELRFYDRLTARENLDFLLGLRGRRLDDEEYGALLDQVGLSPKAVSRSYAGEFSTGMGQRLKMAALLAAEAEIWLLDEPGANLDADGQAMVAREARAAAERGVLVAIATNAPGEEALADACIPLDGH